jgi:uncharacterized membrane protein YkoI
MLSLSALLSAPAALAELNTAAASAEQGRNPGEAQDTESDRRLLREFRAARLQLTQAIEIAERLHRGSRAAAARFELSDAPAYRVITVSSGEAWENLIDANTGRIAEPEITSSLGSLDREGRRNVAALGSVAEELSDAVRVAEKAADGKAFGGGLINDEGKLNFFVVVLSEDELKEVRLEPPKSGRKGALRYRLR